MILPNIEPEEGKKGTNPITMSTMEFDDSFLNLGSGATVVFIYPSKDLFPFSFKLDFKNTNNTTKYEAFLLGLQEAKAKGIKKIKVKGDAKLIVKLVRN